MTEEELDKTAGELAGGGRLTDADGSRDDRDV